MTLSKNEFLRLIGIGDGPGGPDEPTPARAIAELEVGSVTSALVPSTVTTPTGSGNMKLLLTGK